MRRFLLMLLAAVALAFPVRAETAREQARAPVKVRTTFSSPAGGTVIEVDASVAVPEVDAMYRIPVAPRVFGDEMAEKLAALFWPELQGPPKTKDVREARYAYHEARLERWGTARDDRHVSVVASYYAMKGIDGPFSSSLCAELRLGNDKRLSGDVNYNAAHMDSLIDGEGIEGHPLTRADAEGIALTFLRRLTDEPFEVFFVGQAPGIIYDDQLMLDGLESKDTGSSYVVSLTRQVEGAPVLSMGMCMDLWDRSDLLYAPAGYEEAVVAMDLEGRVTHFRWSAPYLIGEMRQPQTLLPFEDILAVAERTLPLMHTWEETVRSDDYGPHRITHIALGYMAVLEQETMRYALTPVWCFYDTQAYRCTGGFWRESFVPDLAVSAVDGRVIDIRLGY